MSNIEAIIKEFIKLERKNFEIYVNRQKALLGYILFHASYFDAIIDEEEAFDNVYKTIFKELKRQYIESNYQLQKWNMFELNKIADISDILRAHDTYMSYYSSVSEVKREVEKIKQEKANEKIFYKLFDIQRSVLKDNEGIAKSIEEMLVLLFEKTAKARWITAQDIIKKSEEREVHYIFSKYKKFKELFFAYRTADLHVIAARPGIGKTTFLLNEVLHFIEHKHKTAFITLEMPAQQCLKRIIANKFNISLFDLNDSSIYKAYVKRFNELEISKNLMFFEDYSVDVEDVLAHIRYIANLNYKVIVIDQLSHIKHKENAYSKADAVEKTVRALRSLALELNICIIIAAQINRSALQEAEPALEHLKESGSIEEASQVVIMLHKKKTTDELKIYVRKATHGVLGEASFNFLASYARISDIYELASDLRVSYNNNENENEENIF